MLISYGSSADLPAAELVMEFKRFNFCTLTLQSLHSLSQWRAQSRSGRTSRTARHENLFASSNFVLCNGIELGRAQCPTGKWD